MKTSSIRDAVALIEFADILERGMKCGVVYFLVTYLLLICCLFCLQVEIQGMKTSSVRDAVALIEFADILERGMKSRVDWDELKAAKKLKQLRQEQKHNRHGF